MPTLSQSRFLPNLNELSARAQVANQSCNLSVQNSMAWRTGYLEWITASLRPTGRVENEYQTLGLLLVETN
jgi:hypothetical protein